MNKGDLVKVGDLVKLKIKKHTSVTGNKYRFRLATEDIQYVESEVLAGKTGIVILVYPGDYCGTLHIAFGSTVIRAYQDYFTKLEKV